MILLIYSYPGLTDDPKILDQMSQWGPATQQHWPIGVVWIATYLVFLGTSYGTKNTYRSALNAFHIIFDLLCIKSPFFWLKVIHLPKQTSLWLWLLWHHIRLPQPSEGRKVKRETHVCQMVINTQLSMLSFGNECTRVYGSIRVLPWQRKQPSSQHRFGKRSVHQCQRTDFVYGFTLHSFSRAVSCIIDIEAFIIFRHRREET